MKTKITKNKKVLCAVVVVLVAAIIASAFVLGTKKKIEYKPYGGAMQAVEFDESFDLSIGSDTNKLYVNSKNSAVVFCYNNGNTIFNSNSTEAAKDSLASVVNVKLRDKNGNIYSMDSYKNSVELGSFSIAQEGNKITAKYQLFPDSESLEKGMKKADVYAEIPVDFIYENNSFKVSVDTEKIVIPRRFVVEKILILPGVASVGNGDQSSFYTVPDGCGAQINLAAVTDKAINLNLPVYGNDASFHEQTEGALLPFFAVTKSNALMNVIIEDGDALSEISCRKEAIGGGYLYNAFTVTPCSTSDDKVIIGESYNGLLTQKYVLSDDTLDYNDISAQVRDSLVERGYLSPRLNGIFNDLPFFVNVLCSADGKNQFTTFEEAAEITAFLKSRGVRNIALRVSGAGKDGLGTISENLETLSSKSGGKSGFENLCKTINEQGNSLWIDSNILIGKQNRKNNPVRVYDKESKFAGFLGHEFSLLDIKTANDNISKTYNLVTDFQSVGVCLNDASQLLYSDLKNDLARQDVLENLRDKTCSLSASGNLMLSHPAVYLMSEAHSVFTAPDTSSLDSIGCVKSVPLLQMVLHGGIVYGSSYMNVTNLSEADAILRCIEYGAVPAFVFTHSGTSLDYSSYAALTAKYYAKAKRLLPMMDMKMTSHECVLSGVYKITYDYSKVVYVNYNPSVVEVDGIMISEKDFVII